MKQQNTAHTPGPWAVNYSPADGFSVWHDPRQHGDMKRGAVIIAADLRAKPETEANARLIAAAPDLLAALRDLLEWGRDNTSPRDDNSPHNLLIAAAAAIAKAGG